MNIRELSHEELVEESFVDLTYALLQESRETKTYKELVEQIETLLGLEKEEMKARLVQFYTDMNIDGRFLILGENRWGLREWYPVEQIEEESAPTVKIRKKKAKVAGDVGFDDVELELDDELDFEDFDEDDDDDDSVIAPPIDADALGFGVEDDDEDKEDVDVLVEDMDGNIIDEEEEEEDDDEEDEEEDFEEKTK